MRKIIGEILIILALGFGAIQFWQPQKNLAEENSNDFLHSCEVPENIATILKESCYDCHSNNTHYLWYHKIAPVSWMVDRHIQEGKQEVNFSEWRKLDIYDQIKMLDEITREVERKTMPLKSYKLMHPKARLSDAQLKSLEEWTRKQGEELLKNAIN